MTVVGIAVVVLYTLVGAVFALNLWRASNRAAAAYSRFYARGFRLLRPAGFGNDRVGYWRISGAFMMATGGALLVLIVWIALYTSPT